MRLIFATLKCLLHHWITEYFANEPNLGKSPKREKNCFFWKAGGRPIFASKAGVLPLKRESWQLCIVDVADTDEYLALSAEHLRRIVSLDELGVRDEEAVLHVISKWIKHDCESRKKHAKDLLNLVRFALIDLEKCKTLFMELQIGELVVEKVTEDAKKEGTVLPRTGCQDVLLVVGGDIFRKAYDQGGGHYCNVSNEARYCDPFQDVWNSFPSLIEPRSCPGLVTLNNVQYAVGGEMVNPEIWFSEDDDREEHAFPLETVERYNSKQHRWVADVEPMSYPGPGNEVTSCCGRIFGISLEWIGPSWHPKANNWFAEAYNPAENKWFPISSPSKPSYRLEDVIVAALSDQVYVFYRKRNNFRYMKYDPIEDRWQSFSPAPFSFRRTSETEPNFTVTINGSIYFFSSGSSSVSFSSKNELWSRFSLRSDIASDLCYHCGGGAGDSNKFYFYLTKR